MAWRQTHDSPNHGMTVDGPFSFCSFPFLLNPRAKSKLLHTEARCLMTQVNTKAVSVMRIPITCDRNQAHTIAIQQASFGGIPLCGLSWFNNLFSSLQCGQVKMET